METKRRFLKGCTAGLDLSRQIAPISPPRLLPSAHRSFPGERSRTSFANEPAWSCWCTRHHSFPLGRQLLGWVCTLMRSAIGGNDGPRGISPCTLSRDGGVNPVFPPLERALVKAAACALGAATTHPLRRQSRADVTGRAQHALGKPISRSTVWRMLATEAIKPWRYKYGIVPREPHLAEKAGPMLDW
jgi:hypothetical protein